MNIDALNEISLVWIVALQSGYVRFPVWIDWADMQILELKSPPFWLLELSVSQTVDEALVALYHYDCSQSSGICWNHIDKTGLYLGFLYLRFECGELKLEDLLLQAGEKADGTNYKIDCSVFFLLLNEIDGGGPTVPSNVPLKDRVTDLFVPMVKLVQQFLLKLPKHRLSSCP